MEKIKESINAVESEMLRLKSIMSSSDAHQAKCSKLGLEFGKEYPEELAEYKKANEEFGKKEKQLAELLQLEAEEEEKHPIMDEETTGISWE